MCDMCEWIHMQLIRELQLIRDLHLIRELQMIRDLQMIRTCRTSIRNEFVSHIHMQWIRVAQDLLWGGYDE